MFERSFSCIAIPQLQDIPMALLGKFAYLVDQEVLDKLKQNLEVFDVSYWSVIERRVPNA